MSVSSQMHAAPAGLFHSPPAIHSHWEQWPIKEISVWCSSINHDKDQMLSDLGVDLLLSSGLGFI